MPIYEGSISNFCYTVICYITTLLRRGRLCTSLTPRAMLAEAQAPTRASHARQVKGKRSDWSSRRLAGSVTCLLDGKSTKFPTSAGQQVVAGSVRAPSILFLGSRSAVADFSYFCVEITRYTPVFHCGAACSHPSRHAVAFRWIRCW